MASLLAKVLVGGVVATMVGGALGRLAPTPSQQWAAPVEKDASSTSGSEPASNAATTAEGSASPDAIADNDPAHCLGWDDALPSLKDAVKRSLRDPSSLSDVQTVWSPVDRNGNFGLIMTYHARNGFGGMNAEAVGVEVNVSDCSFKRASVASLAKRLRS